MDHASLEKRRTQYTAGQALAVDLGENGRGVPALERLGLTHLYTQQERLE